MSAILEGSNSTIQAQLGFKGETGDSAYEIAVKHGYTGTEAQWSDDFLNAENYYDKTEMDTTLGNYDTSAEVDAKIVGKIKNANSASTTDTYSCNYINENIVDSGSNSNGYYVKYYDGTMICWCSDTVTSTSSTVSGLYYSGKTFTFPVEFTATPVILPSIIQPSGIFWAGLGNAAAQTKSGCQVRAIAGSSFTDVDIVYGYTAIGKWK